MRSTPALVYLWLAVAAGAQTPAPPTKPEQPAGALAPQVDELMRLRQDWDAAKAAQQGAPDVEAFQAARARVAARAMELMSTDPRSDLAVRTRIWFVTSRFDVKAGDALLDELVTQDLASPLLAQLADELRPGSLPRSREVVATLAEKAGDRSVRGRALRMLADHQKRDLERLRAAEATPENAVNLFAGESRNRIDALQKMGSAALEKECVAMLARVVQDYGDVPDARGRPLGPRAEGAMFEIEHLDIGKIPPAIEGESIDGVAFKTSDYRGKIVVLDFWGNW